jgi:hypothetical protein
MKKTLLLLLLFAAIAGIASTGTAQIGRTLEQCEARYGDASKQGRDSDGMVTKCFFERPNKDLLSRNYVIIAEFSNGMCSSIMYTIKADEL